MNTFHLDMFAVLEHVIIPDDSSLLVRYDQEATIEALEYHQHREVEFQFTESGYGHRIIGGVLEPFDSQGVLIIPSGVPHTWIYENLRNNPAYRIQEYNIQFDLDLVTKRMASFPEFSEGVSFFDHLKEPCEISGQDAVRIRGLMKRMLHQDGVDRLISFFQIVKICSLSCLIRQIHLEQTNFDNLQKQSRIHEAYAFMNEHMCENIGIEDVSQRMNMSKTSFCNFFKRATGKTFTFALNEMRINRAAMLLTNNTDLSVADIAYSVGFNSPSRFSHLFRKMRGKAPKSYR